MNFSEFAYVKFRKRDGIIELDLGEGCFHVSSRRPCGVRMPRRMYYF